MHPALGPEQAVIVRRVAELSRETFATRAERYDRESRFPTENYADLHRAGLLGLTVPRTHGGLGVDWLTHRRRQARSSCGLEGMTLEFA